MKNMQKSLLINLAKKLRNIRPIKNTDELADIMEVIYALADIHGCTPEQLEDIRAEKAEKRGGFNDKIFLIKVED